MPTRTTYFCQRQLGKLRNNGSVVCGRAFKGAKGVGGRSFCSEHRPKAAAEPEANPRSRLLATLVNELKLHAKHHGYQLTEWKLRKL